MSTSLDKLTEDQKEVYRHLVNGASISEIAELLGRPESIIAAQRTRILNKGVDLHGASPSSSEQDRLGSTSSAVVGKAATAGSAEYDVEKVIEEVKKQGSSMDMKDVHPMILLGVTIQYMKMAGGRMHAHQMIEDVYGALRSMVDGGNLSEVPGATTETRPWPPQEDVSASALVQEFKGMQDKLEAFLRKQ